MKILVILSWTLQLNFAVGQSVTSEDCKKDQNTVLEVRELCELEAQMRGALQHFMRQADAASLLEASR